MAKTKQPLTPVQPSHVLELTSGLCEPRASPHCFPEESRTANFMVTPREGRERGTREAATSLHIPNLFLFYFFTASSKALPPLRDKTMGNRHRWHGAAGQVMPNSSPPRNTKHAFSSLGKTATTLILLTEGKEDAMCLSVCAPQTGRALSPPLPLSRFHCQSG